MLEVIEKTPQRESDKPPLLFVHGGWHAAWCWDEHFLDFFADKGYRAVAVSLRGHGNSPAPRSMRLCSIADYVDDVDSVATSLPQRPVVLGHSLGGFVVQKYLESHDAPAAVLLASMPPSGSGATTLRTLRKHPWRSVIALATATTSQPVCGTPAVARESFFSASTPDCDVKRYTALLREEYVAKSTMDTAFLNLPKPDRVTAPLLVLGAEQDGCFTPREVRSTATAYQTEAEFFPKMGHDMMLEPGWEAVAERIHGWLEKTVTQQGSARATRSRLMP